MLSEVAKKTDVAIDRVDSDDKGEKADTPQAGVQRVTTTN